MGVVRYSTVPVKYIGLTSSEEALALATLDASGVNWAEIGLPRATEWERIEKLLELAQRFLDATSETSGDTTVGGDEI